MTTDIMSDLKGLSPSDVFQDWIIYPYKVTIFLWAWGIPMPTQPLSLLNLGVWLLPCAAFAHEGSIRLPLLRNVAIPASALRTTCYLMRNII